jgi:hypothetical protein
MFGLGIITPLMSTLWQRLQQLREDDRGMTTETLVITALLAAAALAAVGLIVGAINSKSGDVVETINGA